MGFEGIVGNLVKQTASDFGIELIEDELGTLSRAAKVMKPRVERKATFLNHNMSNEDASDVSCYRDRDRAIIPRTARKRVCIHDSADGFPSPYPTGVRDMPTPAGSTPILRTNLPRLAFCTFSRDSMGINDPQGFGTSFRDPNPLVKAYNSNLKALLPIRN